jgi:hypothetical protein
MVGQQQNNPAKTNLSNCKLIYLFKMRIEMWIKLKALLEAKKKGKSKHQPVSEYYNLLWEPCTETCK